MVLSVKFFIKYLVALLALSLLAGCQTTPVKQAESKSPIQISVGQQVEPVHLKKVVIKLKRGQELGSWQAGLLCIPHGKITHKGGKVNITTEDLTDVFREEFMASGYEVVGDPNNLFEDPNDVKSTYLIGGLVKDVKANICYPMAGFGNFTSQKGEVYMDVEWQLYSNLERKIIFTTRTEGSSKNDEAKEGGDSDLVLDAFALATQNLLADPKFHNLVTTSPKTLLKANTSSYENSLDIEKLTLSTKSIQSNMNNVRMGVVTVYAGQGHGSGFFVSEKGYVLTNHHVTGDTQYVKVKLATGREVLGEVIRTDKVRDVSLVKVEEEGMSPLPIRENEIGVGSTVYAIGSPLDDALNTTVSRGILSSYRKLDDGLKYIQSDVTVLPGNSGGALLDEQGNVIGITVSGRLFKGVPAGVNFFIPIKEAQEALNINIL